MLVRSGLRRHRIAHKQRQNRKCTSASLKLLSLSKSDNLQEEDEDLDNVNIKGESRKHILLWPDGELPVSDEQLGMIGQKQSECNGPYCCIEHVKPWDVFEWQHDSRDDASHKHYDSKDTEKTWTFSEIHLSLEAEHCHRNGYNNSDAQGQENRLSAVIACYISSHER